MSLSDVDHEWNEHKQWNMSDEWYEVNCIEEQKSTRNCLSTWHAKLKDRGHVLGKKLIRIKYRQCGEYICNEKHWIVTQWTIQGQQR